MGLYVGVWSDFGIETAAEKELSRIYDGLRRNKENFTAAVLFGAFWAAVAHYHGDELTAEEMASAILSMQCPERAM